MLSIFADLKDDVCTSSFCFYLGYFYFQSMQRGRYIRTVTDGFLVEVLRDSSCQVTSKNMPLDVQSQFAGSTLPDVSLVGLIYCEMMTIN